MFRQDGDPRRAHRRLGKRRLASAIVRELTSSTGDISFGAEREEVLKGISTAQRIVQMEWR